MNSGSDGLTLKIAQNQVIFYLSQKLVHRSYQSMGLIFAEYIHSLHAEVTYFVHRNEVLLPCRCEVEETKSSITLS